MLVAVLPDYLKDFTRFAYLTGWRKGEIISLRWADVDKDGGAIRLRPEASKNGKGRTVVLDGELDALIERRWKARLIERNGKPHVTDLVFHRDGEPVGDFRKAWVTACFEAELVEPVLDENDQRMLGDDGKPKLRPSKLFHDLRRTAARNMVRAGVPERVAMEIIGHRTRSMFDRYNIVSEDDVREAMDRTATYVASLPTERTVTLLVAAAGGGGREHGQKADKGAPRQPVRVEPKGPVGGSGWESNPLATTTRGHVGQELQLLAA
jgi:integrase